MNISWNKIDGNLISDNIKRWTSIYWINWRLDLWYARPTEWLDLSNLTDTDQQVEILTYVQDHDSNFVALLFEWDYTVDWWDWNIENVASWVKAYHAYDYSNTNLNSDTVAKFWYKQCIIKITPNWWNLTKMNLDQYHPTIWSWTSYDKIQPFLDIIIAWPQMTSLEIHSRTSSYDYVSFYNIQKIKIVITADNDLSYLCYKFYWLKSFELISAPNNTNMSCMFQDCKSLSIIHSLDTSSVTNMSYMFQNCYGLTTIPLFDTSNVSDMSSMFYACYSLTTIPLLDTSNVSNMNSMFKYCVSLLEVPLLDTSNVSDMSSMFYYCFSLSKIPSLNTSSVTSSWNIIYKCYSITRVEMWPPLTFSVANARMSWNALNEMYTALPNVSWQTVTVTWNYWTATDNPTIATAKWWTVTS